MLISENYRKLNEKLHETEKEFGTYGMQAAPQIHKLVLNLNTTDVLDYGCGKGTLGKNLPFTIKEYDPAVEGKTENPEPADIVVCTDVLEHIEPDYIDDVLEHLTSKIKKAGYLQIANGPANKTLADGRNAHLIQKGLIWWAQKLENYCQVINFERKGPIFIQSLGAWFEEYIMIVGPKPEKGCNFKQQETPNG